MIAVHDPEVAERLRRLRQHAMDVSDLARHGAADVVIEHYPERGWNYRMTDMQAALGLCQLELLDEILDRARAPGRALHRGARSDPVPRAAVRARVRASGPGSPTRCALAAGRADRRATS